MERQSNGIRFSILLLVVFLVILPGLAQESRWKELNARVIQLYQEGKYAEAVPLAQESLRVAEATFGPEHPNVATSLNYLAGLYFAQGRYTQAEPLYKRALAIREKSLGPDHPDVAKSLSNLANLYWAEGKYAEAEPLYKRALAILEKSLGPDHPDVAASLNNLAVLYADQGKYAEAEPLYKQALAIREKSLGPDHPDVAKSLNNLANLYEKEGKYAEAEPLYKRALAILEKSLGPDHSDVAASLNNLAVLYREQGKYAEAEPLYKQALAIREKSLGPDHPDVAASLNNLAVLYREQGKYAEAEPLYKQALAIREKSLGADHPDVAASLNNLAMLYLTQGKYAEAELLYKHALAIREKSLGPDHPDVAGSLNNLAVLYREQDKYAEAEPLYKRALAIREKSFGADHPDVAQSLNNLANLYGKEGKYAEAEPLYKRTLAILEKSLGPDHPNVATSLNYFAMLYWAQGKYNEAEPFFERDLQNLSKQFEYSFSYMSEKERLAYLATVQNQFTEYFSFCFTYRQQVPELVGKMYDTVLWQKGFVAQSVAALRAKIQESGDPEALKLLDALTETKRHLAKLISAPAEADTQKRAERTKQIGQLEQEANELEKELVQRSGMLAEEKRLAHVTWQQVRDALKKDEAALEIVSFPFWDGKKWTGQTYYVALIITADSQQPTFVVLGDAKNLEAEPLQDYRLLVSGEKERPQAVGRKFYETFWRPLESPLGSARRVYVSTDGVLNQVSLGVVPRSDGKLLMEAYDLRIVSSTKDLLRTPHPSANNWAVLVGNPEFLLSSERQRKAVARLRTQVGQQEAMLTSIGPNPSGNLRSGIPAGRGACDPPPPHGGVLCPLPGTAVEVQSIASLLRAKNWQVAVYQEENALEEVVKWVQNPRVLHLSTHGFFLPDQQIKRIQALGEDPAGFEDPMMRSGLFFAGADRVLVGDPPLADADNGVLTAYEATTLSLQGTELVVLSACETGLGKTQAGEGVFGLQRALQEAGAESVVMSMWAVPDKETHELMSLFYDKWLGGMDKHEALRTAQQQMRERVRAHYKEDLPFYWGAFVLIDLEGAQRTNTHEEAVGTGASSPPSKPMNNAPLQVRDILATANLIQQVQPIYPPLAKTAHISGTVVLHAIIAEDGSVAELDYVSGPPLLMKSAMDAVKQWRYKPMLLNGEPVQVDTTISVVFELGK